mmetsp:Transcript_80325/g.215309  ORF Transcript_80325/g.215309 Transcript_80325/m.215309 type:complete len:255 (+) Transcript_80325:323-1087(+)
MIALRVPAGEGVEDDVDGDAGEVDVDDDHEVELAEELELLKGPRGLVIAQRRVLEVADRPHDGEQRGAAAEDVEEVEDVPPRQPAHRRGRHLLDDDRRDVDHHLEGDDHHDDALVARGEEGLDKRPAGAHKQHHREEHDALEPREDVGGLVPAPALARGADHLVAHRVQPRAQHLDSAEHGHEDVYPVCRLSVAKHDNHPDHKRDQESKEKNAETDWQGDASGGEHLASPVGQSHMEIVRDHGSFGTVCIDYCV